jgi:hypothetical protein
VPVGPKPPLVNGRLDTHSSVWPSDNVLAARVARFEDTLSGVTGYRVQLVTLSSGAPGALWSSALLASTWDGVVETTLDTHLPCQNYWWRVTVFNGGGIPIVVESPTFVLDVNAPETSSAVVEFVAVSAVVTQSTASIVHRRAWCRWIVVAHD